MKLLSTSPRLTSSKLQRVHFNVVERCMRHHPYRTVGLDALLVNTQQSGRVHLAAVYWTAPSEGIPEIHEKHFFLQGDDLIETTLPTTCWKDFAWKITPDGELSKVR